MLEDVSAPPVPGGVALTAAAVGRERAEESARPDGLVRDPWASALVDAAVAAAPESPQWRLIAEGMTPSAMVPAMCGFLALRTRWLDDAVLAAVAGGIRQVVVLGDGFDTRALRLPWPAPVDVITVDQPAVIEIVRRALDREEPEPGVRWTRVPADLTGPWASELRATGFDPGSATAWIIEGVLMYLDPAEAGELLRVVRELSAPGSAVFADVPRPPAVEDTAFRPGRPALEDNSSPVRVAVTCFGSRGWQVREVDPAALAAGHERPVPPVLDPRAPGGPSFGFVESRLSGATSAR
ncbi:SAM-dependent methyltransferase [Saccharopolyspora sp. MS10]|uniref:SAM-dependent methyltransferase n=1 Tax=Saccharopolyspora sp. MS10 TaxID=3385973 RepID=UPI0039A31B0A